jgi:hypothetical protein
LALLGNAFICGMVLIGCKKVSCKNNQKQQMPDSKKITRHEKILWLLNPRGAQTLGAKRLMFAATGLVATKSFHVSLFFYHPAFAVFDCFYNLPFYSLLSGSRKFITIQRPIILLPNICRVGRLL